MSRIVETVIIGGGQAGLSLSYFLTQAGREHIILEKSGHVADAWRNRRWDSFSLVTPNWSFRLPGAEYNGPEPGAFMQKSEIVRRFEQYEQENQLPILYQTEVQSVDPIQGDHRFRTVTTGETYESMNVVMATGMFQKVKIPSFAAMIPQDILQITSDSYRNPYALPPGAVLVVGSGQSGSQIAEELNEAGRKVFLSTGKAGRLPRRYRGVDGFDWLNKIGFFDRTLESLNSPKDRFFTAPHVSGKNGGHELNLHKFSRDGILLLGHLVGYVDGKLVLKPDLAENLALADRFAANVIHQFDTYIENKGLNLPKEEVVIFDDGYRAPEVSALDLAAEGIRVIIWATGYSIDYTLVHLPVTDAYGFLDANRGVTAYPGLYFLGFNWMNKLKSGFLWGVAESAQYLAEVICVPQYST